MGDTGRPSDYTIETAQAICAGLALGKSLKRVTEADGMPSIASVYRWLAAQSDFREMYARAKEDSADVLAEEIIDIADDGQNDTYIKKGRDGDDEEIVNHDHINRSRLRVDARKWVAAKLKPRKYGEKIQQEITGRLTIEQILDQASKPVDGQG